MPRRPKNRNSVKLKALKLLDSASPASSVAEKVRVHRSTIYRWKKKQVQLTKAKAPRAETVNVMQGSSPFKDYVNSITIFLRKAILRNVARFVNNLAVIALPPAV
eukprot:jgi/Phyca11/21819/fgenesh1_pg.PHYCAscaffold_131_\